MGRINYLAERTNTSGSHVTQIKLRWKHMWLCKKRREPAWVRGSLARSSVGTNPELGHVTGASSRREGAWPAVWLSCKSSACPGLSSFDTRSRMELEKLFLRSKLGDSDSVSCWLWSCSSEDLVPSIQNMQDLFTYIYLHTSTHLLFNVSVLPYLSYLGCMD